MSDDKLTKILTFIHQRNPEVGELKLDDDLIDRRAVDSLAFVEFLYLLEELSGETIDPEEIDVEDFRTLRAIDKRFLHGAAAH
ncbi:acyl carrier protein [Streptomyces bauhiniae]|uniref:Acyl carrier protein n=1 Tax=Streptomyces bauhiniae TaxID=2340725 RepID=A0A4Z1D291_9ACTN|nr:MULTISPECIES: acyl carrier protein [Streptomyces]MYZ08389.1 acyl carrier protein [Streptomyces sp. SID2999]TGN75660.1 acyl carrier protein [Streptomyces bauhiniae]